MSWQNIGTNLKKLSKYSEIELHRAVSLIKTKIKFINVELIPRIIFAKAEELTKNVDIDDTEFVALQNIFVENSGQEIKSNKRHEKTEMEYPYFHR